ncbi:MAG: hypothetical protein LC125_06760 [Burkholderiales bacterium]|nr:hypothetical protein [Burkholderiales bacterium]
MTAPSWGWMLLLSVLGGGKLPELPAYREARHVSRKTDEDARPLVGEDAALLIADTSVTSSLAATLLGMATATLQQLRGARR